jgi:hypothetical protein
MDGVSKDGKMRNRISRSGFLAASWLLCIGILAQVYLVGLSLLGGRPSWDDHIGLGHSLGGLALLMVVFAYLGQLTRSMKLITWLNFGIYFLIADVVIFMRDSAPVIAALHPVLAVILFSVAATLAVRIWLIVRAPQGETTAAPHEPIISSTAG